VGCWALIDVNLLPKPFQRVREPFYWRLLAVSIPLVAFAVALGLGALQALDIDRLAVEERNRRERLALLAPAVTEQRALAQRAQVLEALLAVAAEVRAGHLAWTDEIAALLAHLPRERDAAGAPSIDFRSLNLRSIHPPARDPNRYEGAAYGMEASITGSVRSPEVLAAFIRNLERSTAFGVAFQNTSLEGDVFRYAITAAGLEGRP
jgi:hypothetical protein